VRDSDGRMFQVTCTREEACKAVQRSGPVRGDKPSQLLHTGSRLVGVCDLTAGGALEGPYDCRPLLCGGDADCPPLHGMKDGQCLNGRCSDPAKAVSADDAIMLCLSGTGLGKQTAEQVERYALALNCGTPCKVPSPCAQP
jgi:hypothetical protein